MITLYSKNNCSYCTMAKGFFKNNNIAFQEVNIEEDTAARDFILSEGHRSMPQIYLNGSLLVSGGWVGLNDMGIEGFTELLNKAKEEQAPVELDISNLGTL